MERENHFAYSSADFLTCSGYYQADVEKANHRCLQYVTAQLCRGPLNLLEENKAVAASPISNHFLIVHLLGTQILICVFACIPLL